MGVPRGDTLRNATAILVCASRHARSLQHSGRSAAAIANGGYNFDECVFSAHFGPLRFPETDVLGQGRKCSRRSRSDSADTNSRCVSGYPKDPIALRHQLLTRSAAWLLRLVSLKNKDLRDIGGASSLLIEGGLPVTGRQRGQLEQLLQSQNRRLC